MANQVYKKSIVGLIFVLLIIILLPSFSIADNRLEIMGFYLGMTTNDAVSNINKLGIADYRVITSGISFGANMGNWLQINSEHKINYMLLTYQLFDAQNLSLNDFVKHFSHNYHLSMKYDSMRNAYIYKNNNCEVVIPSDPMGIVIIRKIPKAQFNVRG